ncbi:hypothetical protein LKL54_16160, partial [Listeria monocytogenes ATCC 19115]|nr:hypothetical protein [Listeria monocytogenes ATCC 19115]
WSECRKIVCKESNGWYLWLIVRRAPRSTPSNSSAESDVYKRQTGNITLEDSSKFKSFVGGMGFGYKIMYDEVPPGTKPSDKAINSDFPTAPLTGPGAPFSWHL